MPIFMDRHIVPGITLADATAAHNLDVAIQDEYACSVMTFWADEERGCAFCLIHAPDEQAVRDLHKNAHGLIPHEILEVEQDVVMAFLGRINDPESGEGAAAEATAIFCEPAYRAILVTKLKEAALMPLKYGKKRGRELFSIHSEIIENALNRHEGREVHHTRDGFMASFVSIGKSVNCAAEIQNQLKKYNNRSESDMVVATGLSAGVPVTGTSDLFGEAIKLAERLCYLSADSEQIMLSSEVVEKYGANRLRNLSETNAVKSLNAAEEHFLTRLMDVIESVWDHVGFSLDDVCKQMGVSRSQLYRNITALTGHSFIDFIKEFRLNRALELIEKEQGNITTVAFETGFNNPSYFSKCFKEQFDMLPSEYAKAVS